MSFRDQTARQVDVALEQIRRNRRVILCSASELDQVRAWISHHHNRMADHIEVRASLHVQPGEVVLMAATVEIAELRAENERLRAELVQR